MTITTCWILWMPLGPTTMLIGTDSPREFLWSPPKKTRNWKLPALAKARVAEKFERRFRRIRATVCHRPPDSCCTATRSPPWEGARWPTRVALCPGLSAEGDAVTEISGRTRSSTVRLRNPFAATNQRRLVPTMPARRTIR